MSSDRETTRIVRSWLDEGVTQLPDRVLDAVLDQVPATPQRRRVWSAWRYDQMNLYAKLLVGAAAVLALAVVAYQFLPGRGPGLFGSDGTPFPTASPSPTSTPVNIHGAFHVFDGDWEVDATGSGDSVTGTIVVAHPDGDFRVDLECTRTTEDGVILLAGDIVESTSPFALQGAREILTLKPGSPLYVSFDSEGRRGGDVRPADSCPELLQQVIDTGTQTVIGDNGMVPIDSGSVDFGP